MRKVPSWLGATLTTLTDHIEKHGTTLIVATHDDDVAGICSRIIRLQDGKIVDA